MGTEPWLTARILFTLNSQGLEIMGWAYDMGEYDRRHRNMINGVFVPMYRFGKVQLENEIIFWPFFKFFVYVHNSL